MTQPPAHITDADYEVVSGPYRIGEEHRREKGWHFTGHYDAEGDPIFIRPSWFKRREFLRKYSAPLILVGVPVLFMAGLVLLAGVVVAAVEIQETFFPGAVAAPPPSAAPVAEPPPTDPAAPPTQRLASRP